MKSIKLLELEIAKIKAQPFTTKENNETIKNLAYVIETLKMIRG